jgi:hypothetical protein
MILIQYQPYESAEKREQGHQHPVAKGEMVDRLTQIRLVRTKRK